MLQNLPPSLIPLVTQEDGVTQVKMQSMTPRHSLQPPLILAWPLQLPDVVLMTKLQIPGYRTIARYPIYCALLQTMIIAFSGIVTELLPVLFI